MPDLVIERNYERRYTVFRLNRPDRMNALSPEMLHDLDEGLAELAADDRLRVGIVTGTGRAFSSGADLKAASERGETETPRGPDAIPKFPFGSCPKPMIAALNGACIAAGMELAIDCDIRIASTDAYFGLFEAKRGIMAGIAVVHLARVMPTAEAMYLLLTADTMSAQRAREIGFVREVTEPADLMPRAIEIASMIAANAPLSIQASKAMVQFWRHYAVEEARRLEAEVWETVFGSEDAKEGVRAFVEHREPIWKGR